MASILSIGLLAGCTGPSSSTQAATASGSPAATTPAAADSTYCSGEPAAASFAPLARLPKAGGAMPAGSTMADIKARGRLIVGTSGDKPLLAARDPQTGQLTGIDIDLSRAVAKAIFGNPDAVEFRTITYAAREPALINHQVDMVAHSMTMTCKRWKTVSFSSPYYQDAQRVMVRSDSPAKQVKDLVHSTICVAKGTTTIDNLAKYRFQKVVQVDDAADCLALFQRDEVDAVTSNELILLGYQKQDPYAKIIGDKLSSEPEALAFPRADVDFVRFVNAVLVKLNADGELDRMLRRRLAPFHVPVVVPIPIYGRTG